jgi:transposase
LLAAVSTQGLQGCSLHEGNVNKAVFLSYLKDVLLPGLEPGSILVMDNWTVHHAKDVTSLIEAYGCHVFYLPTYSPDFNPIEYLFAKIKSFVKKAKPQTTEELCAAFIDGVLAVTPEDAVNTFESCGYV